MARDLFSHQSAQYARYRPEYPGELFTHLCSMVADRHRAWDCATGNGQAAKTLAGFFDRVDASDISLSQLQNAARKNNIHYHHCPAEHTPFKDSSFNLITVAQAYHWLDWEAFRREATRVGTPGAIVAIWAYTLCICEDERINRALRAFYDFLRPYWDPARRYVEEEYRSVAFDYEELPPARFEMKIRWNREEVMGYLATWSAVQAYQDQHQRSPMESITADWNATWCDGSDRSFHFPIALRVGRICK